MCNNKVRTFRTIEVDIPTTGQRDFPLPLDEILRDAKIITGVSAYKAGDAAFCPISGAAVVNDTVFGKSFLTLQTKANEDVIVTVPLTDLHRPTNNGVLFSMEIPPINITKCRVTVPENTSVTITEKFLFSFYYER